MFYNLILYVFYSIKNYLCISVVVINKTSSYHMDISLGHVCLILFKTGLDILLFKLLIREEEKLYFVTLRLELFPILS